MDESSKKTWEQAEYDKRWGDAADAYSASRTGYTSNFLRFMSERLKEFNGRKDICALEVGCGDGFFSAELTKRGCRVTGVDLSPAGIAKSKKRVPSGEFLVHDLSRPLPFASGTFEVVWCSEVLEHLFSPLAVLEEIYRVLRPGGILLATVPYHGFLKNVGIALFAFDRHYDPTYPHIRFFTRNTLVDLARRVGFTAEKVTSCGSGLGLRDWVVPTNILLAARKPPSSPLAK